MYAPLESVGLTLRATTRTPDTETPWPDPGTAPIEELRGWIHDLHTRDHALIEAPAVASPSLVRQLDAIVGADAVAAKKVRRAAVSLMRYLLRYGGRPTPYGLFAGVAPLTSGGRTRVRWGEHHRETAQPASAWLAVRARHHPVPGSFTTVVAASTARVRGDRLVLSHKPGADDPRQAAEVSVRLTPAVALVVENARTPVPLAELLRMLGDSYPDADPREAAALVDSLLEHRILIGSQRSPVWHPRPLAHLADHDPGLKAASELLECHNDPGTPAGERPGLRGQILRRLPDTDTETLPRLAVDTRLDVDLVLPHQVAHETARAAGVLATLAPHPTGHPAWIDYHTRCLETYGQGTVVGLLDLTGPAGLGFPHGYRGSRLSEPAPDRGNLERSRILVAALHTAALQGLFEIDLQDPAWQHLSGEQTVHPPVHVELRAQLHAATPEAVDAGDFRLWITAVSRGVGTLTGRFTHLDGMVPADLDRALPTLTERAVTVQVLAPPMADTAAHVARSPVVAAHVLVIDEHPPPAPGIEVINPREVGVRVDADHLRLLHLPTGRVIEPFLASALEPHHYTHPLARFVTELPRARTLPSLGFTWPSAASDCVFLPRLRSGRTVAAPAQWRVTAEDLSTVRSHPPLPQRVQLVEGERCLPLDLSRSAHRHLLETHLARYGTAVLTEAPDEEAFGWCGGRPHELVVPLRRTAAPVPAPQLSAVTAVSARPQSPPVADPPGTGPWLSVHLYTGPDLCLLILDRLPELWDLLGGPVDFWFVRYRDHDGPHLRLRLRTETSPAEPTAAVGTWARSLHACGLLHSLSLHTYRPETARYGHGPALAAAEAFFVADSRAAQTQLASADHDPTRTRALAAASLLRLAAAADTGTTWLLDHLPRPADPVDRAARALAARILTRPGSFSPPLAAAWADRDQALTAYLACLPRPRQVLPSLFHMHHNRVRGPDRDDEQRVQALARAVALTRRHTRTAGKP